MGKRKKSTPKVQKKFYRLPKTFHCPFCNSEDGVKVTMDHKSLTAKIECVKCQQQAKIGIHKISEPIDVYDDWVDQVRESNKNFNPEKVEEVEDEMYEDENPIYEPSRLQSNASRSYGEKHSNDENDIGSSSDNDQALNDSDSDSLSYTE